MVEQVGNGDVECRVALLQALVGDGGGEVSLAAAAGTNQYQPSLRFPGKGSGCLIDSGKSLLINRVPASSLGYQVIKGEAG